jgi:hypothetical protein
MLKENLMRYKMLREEEKKHKKSLSKNREAKRFRS